MFEKKNYRNLALSILIICYGYGCFATPLAIEDGDLRSKHVGRDEAKNAGGVASDHVISIVRLLGLDSEEELNEDLIRHYSYYLAHPLDINMASKSALRRSGLFTGYQIASLMDYKQRYGDIMSFSELIRVPGFANHDYNRLLPFLIIRSPLMLGESSSPPLKVQNSLTLKSGIKAGFKVGGKSGSSSGGKSGGSQSLWYEYGANYHLDISDRGGLALSMRKSLSQKPFIQESKRLGSHAFRKYGSATLYYYGVRALNALVAGNYSVRCGQGLALWSGFSMSSAGSASSLFRSTYGLRPSFSSSGEYSLHGLAAEFNAGPMVIGTFLAADPPSASSLETTRGVGRVELTPGLTLTLDRLWGDITLASYVRTAANRAEVLDAKVSVSTSINIRGVRLCGELAFDAMHFPAYAVNIGTSSNIADGVSIAAAVKSFSQYFERGLSNPIHSLPLADGEHGLTFATDISMGKWIPPPVETGYAMASKRHLANLFADLSFSPVGHYGQLKFLDSYRLRFDRYWQLACRFYMRFRFPISRSASKDYQSSKYALRLETTYDTGIWLARARLEGVVGQGLGGLMWAEGGYRHSKVSTYLKAGVYSVEKWSDRLYIYDRDAPGNFSNLMAYGGGCFLASYTSANLFSIPGKAKAKLYLKLGVRYMFRPPKTSSSSPLSLNTKLQYTMSF